MWTILFGVKDPFAQDSMTNDFHFTDLQPYKPDNTVDKTYEQIRRNCLILTVSYSTQYGNNTRKVSSMKVQIVGHSVLG